MAKSDNREELHRILTTIVTELDNYINVHDYGDSPGGDYQQEYETAVFNSALALELAEKCYNQLTNISKEPDLSLGTAYSLINTVVNLASESKYINNPQLAKDDRDITSKLQTATDALDDAQRFMSGAEQIDTQQIVSQSIAKRSQRKRRSWSPGCIIGGIGVAAMFLAVYEKLVSPAVDLGGWLAPYGELIEKLIP